MCQYCGCRDIPLLRDYIAEHERSTHSGEEALRACERGDFDAAREHLSTMADELRAHWQGEEQGLFAVLRREELYAEHIGPLVREHRELEELLQTVDLEDSDGRDSVRKAVFDLHEHIAKEEDGLFPASLTALGGADWDEAMAAWQEVHPGQHLIGD